MTVADLTPMAPGIPDAGTLDADTEEPVAGELDGTPGAPLSLASVKGLVNAAFYLIHLALVTKYPEEPGIGTLTDDEATRIATALLSMAGRSAALRAILERSDALSLAVALGGWGGRTVIDIRRAKEKRNDPDREAPGSIGVGPVSSGVVGIQHV